MAKSLGLISCFILFFLLTTYFCPCSGKCKSIPTSKTGFSGMFVFGNSLLDSGNNNFLHTDLKANYLPYGIDFPSGHPLPTGRFSNGKNQVDLIAELLGLPLIPISSDPRTKGDRLTHGVNHASAGSGILDATSSNLGVISLNQQIQNFEETTKPSLEAQQNCTGKMLFQHYLFLLTTGSNDYMSNFFQGGNFSYSASLEFFTANLTRSFARQLIRLYNLGARNFAILDIDAMGCTPMVRAAMPNKACNETFNYAASYFNDQLTKLLNFIKPQLPLFQFVVINSFQIGLEFIRYPSRGGFSDVSSPCCEVSKESGGVLCEVGGNVCSNRNSYMFFDGAHPTEALCRIIAAKAYYSNDTSEAYPFNLQRLASLKLMRWKKEGLDLTFI